MNHYTVKVTFDKTFVSGTLKGITVRESVPCVSRSDAYIEQLRKDEDSQRVVAPCAGSSRYTVSNVAVSDIN